MHGPDSGWPRSGPVATGGSARMASADFAFLALALPVDDTELLTVSQVAEALSASSQTIRNWIRADQLRGVRIGNSSWSLAARSTGCAATFPPRAARAPGSSGWTSRARRFLALASASARTIPRNRSWAADVRFGAGVPRGAPSLARGTARARPRAAGRGLQRPVVRARGRGHTARRSVRGGV